MSETVTCLKNVTTSYNVNRHLGRALAINNKLRVDRRCEIMAFARRQSMSIPGTLLIAERLMHCVMTPGRVPLRLRFLPRCGIDACLKRPRCVARCVLQSGKKYSGSLASRDRYDARCT